MELSAINLIQLISYILIILGVIGAVVPVLPGPMLIWGGALLWAWDDGFVRIGAPTLTILLVLALVAWGGDFALNTYLSRRAGASWKAIFGAILGGIVGGVLFSGLIPVPILGSLIGAILGALLGIFAIEYYDKRDINAAITAMKVYLGGMAIAAVVEILISLTMVGIFVWQAFG